MRYGLTLPGRGPLATPDNLAIIARPAEELGYYMVPGWAGCVQRRISISTVAPDWSGFVRSGFVLPLTSSRCLSAWMKECAIRWFVVCPLFLCWCLR
jgi:hypothetical protein